MLAQALTSISYCFTFWLQKGRQGKSGTMGCRHTGLCDVGRKMLVTPEHIHEVGSERQVKAKGRATGNPHVFQHLFDLRGDGLSCSEQETLRQKWTWVPWVPSEKWNSFKIAHNALKSTTDKGLQSCTWLPYGASNWLQLQFRLDRTNTRSPPRMAASAFMSVWQQGNTTSLWEQLRMSHGWYSWYNGSQETWLQCNLSALRPFLSLSTRPGHGSSWRCADSWLWRKVYWHGWVLERKQSSEWDIHLLTWQRRFSSNLSTSPGRKAVLFWLKGGSRPREGITEAQGQSMTDRQIRVEPITGSHSHWHKRRTWGPQKASAQMLSKRPSQLYRV